MNQSPCQPQQDELPTRTTCDAYGTMNVLWLIIAWFFCNNRFVANSFIVRFICHPLHKSRLSTGSQSFDFSSKDGWETFYQSSDEVCEWHSSINQTELIRNYVPEGSSCLISGCGNSRLPYLINELHAGNTKITCLDSSMACLNQLKKKLPQSNNVKFICGDAVALTKTLDERNDHFDVIIDKGLTDALLCGEGWDTPLMLLLRESEKVLKSPGGSYVLVSYRLPAATQKFIQDTSEGLRWSFRLPGSNDRVQISVAKKI